MRRGTSFYSQDGGDAEQLLTEADRKMYTAKQLHSEDTFNRLGSAMHAPGPVRVN